MASRLKQLGALAVIAVGAAGFYWLHLGGNVEWTQEAFQSYLAGLGPLGPAILVGAMAMRPFLGLPSGLILLTAGLLFGTVAGTFYGALGGTLGAVLALGVARALGREAVQRRIGASLAAFRRLPDAPRSALACRVHGRPDLAAESGLLHGGRDADACSALHPGHCDRFRATGWPSTHFWGTRSVNRAS